MDDDFPETFDWPAATKTLERSIGSFILAWSILERELDIAIQVLFQINSSLAPSLYANLGTKTKLDIISSAAHTLSKAFPEELLKDFTDSVELTREYSDKARNVLAHGQLIEFPDLDDSSGFYLVRLTARKTFAMTIHPSDAEHWRMQAGLVATLAQGWRQTTSRSHRILSKLTPDEMDNLCGIMVRESEAMIQRRRKPRPPKKAGSRPTNRGQQK